MTKAKANIPAANQHAVRSTPAHAKRTLLQVSATIAKALKKTPAKNRIELATTAIRSPYRE
jgi:hypothetical protein